MRQVSARLGRTLRYLCHLASIIQCRLLSLLKGHAWLQVGHCRVASTPLRQLLSRSNVQQANEPPSDCTVGLGDRS